MKKCSASQRIGQLELELLEKKPIDVTFDGEDVSGNGGVLLAAQAERLTKLIEGAAARLTDHRTASMIKHNQFEMVAQRVFQIVAGMAACIDSNVLRRDPVMKMAVGRNPLTGDELASQPTQSRLEGKRSYKELYRLCQWLVDYYIQCQPKPPRKLVLDFDGSAIETFGVQLQAFYRGGPYRKYMYFPLFVFDQNGWLLVAALRPGDHGEVEMSLPVLKRLVKRLRQAWPQVRITMRADGAFTDPELYKWLDDNDVDYVLGLKHNNALLSKSRGARKLAERKFKRKFGEPMFTGKGGKKRKTECMKEISSVPERQDRQEKKSEIESRRARTYGDFWYQARSWDRERRVIARCDFTDEKWQVRYVVTSMQRYTAQQIYEDLYCQRALAETWIKNIKETRCDRLSCAQFKSNMFRLLLHALAYILLFQIKCRLPESHQRLSVGQLRRHFISVAVQVRETGTRVVVRVSKSYHAAREFRLVSKRLGAASLIAA
jgi:hypothetical protein